MDILDILALEGIEPKEVAIILHTPNIPKLAKVLPLLVVERPEIYAAYQSVHSDGEGATLKHRKLALTFVNVGAGRMLFAGLFNINGWSDWPLDKIDNDPNFRALVEDFGDGWASDYARDKGETHRLVFDMEPDDRLSQYRGKLVVGKPIGRRLIRKAENLQAQILALHEESALISAPPDWKGMIIGAPEIRAMPPSWAARLREWRGVYLIVDESDGARYVGSAYGDFGFLSRWKAHLNGKEIEGRERGITVELRKRSPSNFRFSILQVFAPDASDKEIIQVENNWMDRLHTRVHGLNHGT
ncbi:MAG TPA: GIY-YIG nuclease family protein [Rhodobacteraceae bacterium]|nr:GIY-YIG nuclease family protein [Paracoccaceae bacterium]